MACSLKKARKKVPQRSGTSSHVKKALRTDAEKAIEAARPKRFVD
jgi:hypothetical protein